jgi:hypothetical protein
MFGLGGAADDYEVAELHDDWEDAADGKKGEVDTLGTWQGSEEDAEDSAEEEEQEAKKQQRKQPAKPANKSRFSMASATKAAAAGSSSVVVRDVRPEDEMNKQAGQLAKLSVAQEGGEEQLLSAAQKRVAEQQHQGVSPLPAARRVLELVLRTALIKGGASGNPKQLMSEFDTYVPMLGRMICPDDAQSMRVHALSVMEGWFSVEGGLAAAAERVSKLGKAVPKLFMALYETEGMDEEVFEADFLQWRQPSASKLASSRNGCRRRRSRSRKGRTMLRPMSPV